jgi:energy-coupling factor transporter ATP-binding protein EcfA2
MTTPLTTEVERTLVAELYRLAAERAAAEKRVRADFTARNEQADKEFHAAQKEIAARFQSQTRATEQEFANLLSRAKTDYDSQHGAAASELESTRRRVLDDFTSREQQAQKQLDTDSWEATTVFEAAHPGLLEQLDRVEARVKSHGEALAAVVSQVFEHLELCRLTSSWQETPVEEHADRDGDPFALLPDTVGRVQSDLVELRGMITPKLFIGVRPQTLWVLFSIFSLVLAWAIVGHMLGGTVWQWLGIGAVAAAVGAGVAHWLIKKHAVARTTALCQSIRQAIADGEVYQQRCLADAKAYYDDQRARLARHHRRDIRRANERHLSRVTEITSDRDGAIVEADDVYERREAELVSRRDKSLEETNARFPTLLKDLGVQHEREQAEAKSRYESQVRSSHALHEAEWAAMAAQWREGMARVYATLGEMTAQTHQFFPPWDDPAWKDWRPPVSPPPAIPFGQFSVRLADVPEAISADNRLNGLGPEVLELPALLPFPHNASLVIQTDGEGRAAGVEVLQAVMLRLLATIPPGKARFTIVDPVGLGENFAGFMHLADVDEFLVTNRIWTEPQHIEARLADLTEQMENVIQKYLRNDFATIAEYNEFAGEVAEAFRILVVANFPVNFTEAAARRLTSIAASGARCGVYILMTADMKQSLPLRFDLKDIQRYSTNLVWEKGKLVWKEPELEKFPLAVEQPPPEDRFTQIVQLVGEYAKDSRRVEVPFEYIAPSPDRYWGASTSRGIDVPLGRAGATKLQHLRLGHGTSQHVLIAGKTGSGKSTLLHALVTNLALTYSPDEIELYLIDFKKGVEFKTYATHELPHARVIAIESEREFGQSVLQSLDGELRRRGDMFRLLGVQDLNGYRQAEPDKPLPRILLVVDEFHELFVEDDKIAQDCGLLMDRLVRQGRAFGIHVLLGSQTLGGAYSLARSTLGQMAVRIALQCSESDAHLILSEDNSAARLLNRPGEAIYNDANGRMEGNNPFQVVWLADSRREEYLEKIRAMARERMPNRIHQQIVFEGNIAADARRNVLLTSLLRSDAWPETARDPQAWLGEAIAIKDPTAAVFRSQNGCNLLLIGQRDEGALGIMAVALASLSAQRAPVPVESNGAATNGNATNGNAVGGVDPAASAIFYILEPGRPADDLRPTLSQLAGVVPHSLRLGGRREAPIFVNELAAEVERRQTAEKAHAPVIFLFVYDLARFRDLRQEEDFGYSSFSGEARPPSPGRQFVKILREGPAVGIHLIVWCDTLNNLQRAVDRQGVREFDLRVMFQMSATDSSQLIDTPAASRLGPNLALFFNEEEGRLEKFRPYAWPPVEWLDWVRGQLQSRGHAEPSGQLPS